MFEKDLFDKNEKLKVRATNVSNDIPKESEIIKSLEEISKNMRNFAELGRSMSAVLKLMEKRTESPSGPRTGFKPGTPPGSPKGKCFNCQEFGHFARECTAEKKQKFTSPSLKSEND